MHHQSLSGSWQFRQAGTADSEDWLPASVPGGVHTDLMALGRLPDPFVGANELLVQWVAESDWDYRLSFQASPVLRAEERVHLVCDGLDTLADVTLNDHHLGHMENMFRCGRWDVTALLAEGTNELCISFQSPVAYTQPRQAERPLRNPDHSRPGGAYLRKVPSHYGWDWGPQLPAMGIWRDVRLEGRSVARLSDVHLRQHHADGRVTVSAQVTVERWRGVDLRAVLQATAPDGSTREASATLSGGATGGDLSIEIADPQLWWPSGYGEQPLYGIVVALYAEERLCDRRDYQVGLRTIELRQQPDQFGQSFTFVVNGVPVFAKGANWIPADSFLTRIGDAQLEHLVRSAAQAHMNMLRVWGGGIYEEERFYDLCDQYGILVWQDFIFSCSQYPDDEAFFENVWPEAVENVRRLRHRASLALWCGNNEMEQGWVEWGWNEPEALPLKAAYDRMFHHVLPGICAQEDPDRPYWPSSPSSGVPFEDPDSVRAGDSHNWEVWHRMQPFSHYRQHQSRFMSEFGFQSLPSLDTIRWFADEADWNMTSYVMERHQKNAAGNGKIITYMTDHFRLPKDFPSLVYLSQLLQAEAVRTGVEHWRRNRACTSGTLYWQLNDCWPVASWASIDYFGRWKALHYVARRFYAPVLLSADDEAERVALHVTSDLTESWQGTVRWSLETLEGEGLQGGQEQVTVPPLGSVSACALDLSGQVSDENRRRVVLVHELWHDGERLSSGVVTFGPNKHLELADPELAYAVRRVGGDFEAEISSRRLARFVWLDLEGADVVVSDNYFDLPAGRTQVVRFAAPEGWDVERVRGALRVCSLVDSY